MNEREADNAEDAILAMIKKRSPRRVNSILIGAFILATLSLAGCGDNELVKGIADVVKKSVEGEVTKKVGEVKKQFDQVTNLGAGKEQKEDGKGDAKAGKESEDEKD